jgi:hypothetical protein
LRAGAFRDGDDVAAFEAAASLEFSCFDAAAFPLDSFAAAGAAFFLAICFVIMFVT